MREQSYIAQGLFRERGNTGGNYVMGIDGVKNAFLATTVLNIRIHVRRRLVVGRESRKRVSP